jgi:hypothetical protein
MIRWRLQNLMQAYQEKTGERLTMTTLAQETGVSPSAVHKHMHYSPMRVDMRTLDSFLRFFSRSLGPLTTQDLVEFVDTPDKTH